MRSRKATFECVNAPDESERRVTFECTMDEKAVLMEYFESNSPCRRTSQFFEKLKILEKIKKVDSVGWYLSFKKVFSSKIVTGLLHFLCVCVSLYLYLAVFQ